MMTIHEVSKLAGVSIRTLQYYDKIDLLHPSGHSDAGYRLYDDTDLERLQHILLFRELEIPLKDIKAILNSPDFDREKALEQQIELLKLKKELVVYRGQLKQALGVKARLEKQMDSLDISDPHYDRKIADLERRYDEQYGKIEEIETLIAEVQEQIQTIRREQISGDNIYQLLLAFDS